MVVALYQKTAVEPEVATQCGYSLVGLLHLYHDYILYKSSQSADEKPNAVQQYVCIVCAVVGAFFRHGDHLHSRTLCFPRRLTRLVRVPLSLITHVQVLAEVLARKIGGEVGKWRLVRAAVR